MASRYEVSLLTAAHHKVSLMTTACPDPGPRPLDVISQAFAPDELERAWRDPTASLIVHHGDAIALSGFDLVHSHTEIVALFSRAGARLDSISLASLVDGLRSDRRTAGGVVLRHGRRLNRRALRFAFQQIGVRLDEPRRERSFGSYAALADAAMRAGESTLMVGLRGLSLARPDLAPVRLDGCCPLSRDAHASYPLQSDVHLYLRHGLPAVARERALDHVALIKRRLSIDNGFFSTGGGRMH